MFRFFKFFSFFLFFAKISAFQLNFFESSDQDTKGALCTTLKLGEDKKEINFAVTLSMNFIALAAKTDKRQNGYDFSNSKSFENNAEEKINFENKFNGIKIKGNTAKEDVIFVPNNEFAVVDLDVEVDKKVKAKIVLGVDEFQAPGSVALLGLSKTKDQSSNAADTALSSLNSVASLMKAIDSHYYSGITNFDLKNKKIDFSFDRHYAEMPDSSSSSSYVPFTPISQKSNLTENKNNDWLITGINKISYLESNNTSFYLKEWEGIKSIDAVIDPLVPYIILHDRDSHFIRALLNEYFKKAEFTNFTEHNYKLYKCKGNIATKLKQNDYELAKTLSFAFVLNDTYYKIPFENLFTYSKESDETVFNIGTYFEGETVDVLTSHYIFGKPLFKSFNVFIDEKNDEIGIWNGFRGNWSKIENFKNFKGEETSSRKWLYIVVLALIAGGLLYYFNSKKKEENYSLMNRDMESL